MRSVPPVFFSMLAGLGLAAAPVGKAQTASPAAAKAVPAPAAASASGLDKNRDYRQALRALQDRQPEVAAVKLERLRVSGKFNGPEAAELLLRLAEAQCRAERPEAVLEVTDAAAVKALPEAQFWRALALVRLERWSAAVRLLEHPALGKDFRFAAEAAFSRAGALAALGDAPRALRVLASWLDGPGATPAANPKAVESSVAATRQAHAVRARLWSADLLLTLQRPAEAEAMLAPLAENAGTREPEVRFLQARLKLTAGDAAAAETLFTPLSESRGKIPPRLHQAALLGRAQALRSLNRGREAMAAVHELISQTPPPEDDLLALAFGEFETLNGAGNPETAVLLAGWAASADSRVKMHAQLAQAAALKAAGRLPEAEAVWTALVQEAPENPLAALALAQHAESLISQGKREPALVLLRRLRELSPGPAVGAWGEWLRGMAEYEAETRRGRHPEISPNAGDPAPAVAAFTAAATQSPSPEMRAKAAYNAAIAELQSGQTDPAGSLALMDEKALPGSRMAGAEFHLERALYLAAQGREGAADGLRRFVEALPDHARAFEAWLALAELALTARPPDPARAAEPLRAAAAKADTPARRERVTLVRVYVAEAEAADPAAATQVLARGEQLFSTEFPQSLWRSSLRMRLAVSHYLRGDYAGARQKFIQLAEEDPQHRLAEPALFWAGRAALLNLGPNREAQAMDLWEQVFRRGGPLKWEARLQEALLNQTRQPGAALQLLEELVNASPPADAATRRQALCTRGEILTAPSMTPAQHAAGLASFDQVAEEAGAPAFWRHQALVRKGVCLELLKRADEALEAYYDVLNEPPPAEARNEDDTWFHRAGEKGQRLLEARGKHKEAVELVKKRAKAPGPRGQQAADLVNRLSLQNFIWTGDETTPR